MDRVKVLYCGYRDWSIRIYEKLEKDLQNIEFSLNKNNILEPGKVDIILFIGWSWIVPSNIVNENLCICAHPSPLPKYRGGSPLQNQIINGEVESAVSLFIMNEQLDGGPIVSQTKFSLLGDLCEVIEDMQNTVYISLLKFLEEFSRTRKVVSYPQDNSNKSYYRRRTEEMSEITLLDIEHSTAVQLHNKIRALQDPYPNAFIQCKDARLYLINSRI